jgi:hypothetical protein
MTSIQQYFSLQLILLKREIIDFGLNPFIGLIISTAGFYGLSFYIFSQTEYANYCYVLFAVIILFKYTETNRNDFIKFNFPSRTYYKIRVLENLITVTPFLIFLCFKKDVYRALLLILLSALFSIIHTKKMNTVAMPTPFYKRPFEFLVGFRNYFILLIFCYMLTGISVFFTNFNLGIFSQILIFLICLTFYSQTENQFYVWVYKLKAKAFLIDKIKIGFLYTTIISLPITLALFYFFRENVRVIIAIQVLGYCYLLAMILTKYSCYPQKISVPQGILFAIGILMPPSLLILIPLLYNKSHKQLKEILE